MFSWFKKNKYGAQKTNGMASKLEAAVYDWLLMMEKNGEINDIKQQVPVPLSAAKIMYKADFSYYDIKLAETIWVEAKGMPGDVWKLKKRLWKWYGPGQLHIYMGSYKNFRLAEVIDSMKVGV